MSNGGGGHDDDAAVIWGFFLPALLCTVSFWLLLLAVGRLWLDQATAGSVVTVPSWMVGRDELLFWIQTRHRRPVFLLGHIGSFALPCLCQVLLGTTPTAVVALSAVLFSVYHLTETSMTNRHGEYPLLYSLWGLALLPFDDYAHAWVWGQAIHFVVSTGYAKIVVGGGFGSGGWCHASTMKAYLTCYRQARRGLPRPLCPKWNERLCNSPSATSLLSLLTLVLECILVPLSLLVPPNWRFLACWGMIGMHLGIASLMSLHVALVFVTSLPVYWYGFACTAKVGSGPWILAATIGLGPTVLSWLRHVLKGGSGLYIPEDWPWTPVSLFLWHGTTASAVLELLMTQDTRMVFATARVAAKEEEMVGLRVLHHGGEVAKSSSKELYLHDAVIRTVGFTLVQGGDPLIQAVLALKPTNPRENESWDKAYSDGGFAVRQLVQRTSAWLSQAGRLVEAHTGETLTTALLVRVDEQKRVVEVLYAG